MTKRRGILLGLLGWLLSLLLVVGLLRKAPFSAIWSALWLVDPRFVVGAMAFASLTLVLRGLRWALFFSERRHISRFSIASLAFIGLAINAVVPGRVGDVARVLLAARKHHVGFTFAATSVLLERLLDGITLLLFLGLSLLSLHTVVPDAPRELLGATVDAHTLRAVLGSLIGACLGLALVTILAGLPRTRAPILSLVSRIPRFGGGAGRKLETVFVEIGQGLRTAGRPSVLAPLLLYSVLVWFALAACNYSVALGMPGIELSYRSALVVTAVAIAAASVPSSPGAWGFFEAAALLALDALGVTHNEATGVAYVFAIHFCQYLPVVLFGFAAALHEHLSLGDLKRLRSRGGSPPFSKDTQRWGTGSGRS